MTGALLPLAGASRSVAASGSHRGGPAAADFTNPVIWQDFADIDVIRVGDTYYASASTMHYSPGAPVLRSYDLVNWEFAGHSVPVLDFGAKYDLNGGRALRPGHLGVVTGLPPEQRDLLLARPDRLRPDLHLHRHRGRGPVEQAHHDRHAYYDAGLLVDNDDTLYVAYGNTTISVAQLSRRRPHPGPHAAGVHHAVERRHPGGLPLLQDQRAATTSS